MKVFISGSISLKELTPTIEDTLNYIIEKQYSIIIGDAAGIDSLIQQYLSSKEYYDVTVYSLLSKPRNLFSNNFTVKTIDYLVMAEYLELPEKEKKKVEFSERKKQAFKDIAMSLEANVFIAIWDGKSEGTKNNILRSLEYKKDCILIMDNNIIPKCDITKEKIENIYEENFGIGLKELKNRLINEIGDENIPSQEFLKSHKELQSIFPANSKTFLNDTTGYKNYIIKTNYKGQESIRYRPSLIFHLKNRIIQIKEKLEAENFSLFKNLH